MRAMLDLHLLNVCTAVYTYFNETIGTGPIGQLVQHNTFKEHLLSYLCGSPDRVYRLQAQQCPVILAP